MSYNSKYTGKQVEEILDSVGGKQDAIADLDGIRDGASKGATAVQPSSLSSVATSGSYNDLSNKPTIPSAVTESTVSGWGFTKNTGTYSKPSGGIPKSDLASAVQTSLTNADTAFNNRIIGTDVNSNYVGEGVADYIEIKDNKIVYVLGTVDKGSVEEGLATSTDVKTYVDSLWEWEEL